jgi:hypothetical protein
VGEKAMLKRTKLDESIVKQFMQKRTTRVRRVYVMVTEERE